MLVDSFLEASAERSPDKIALVCGDRRFRYSELELRANRLAHALRRAGVERGDRVQFSLRFRGRELAHIDEGIKVFGRVIEMLADIAKVEQHSRREGRRITMLVAPLGGQQVKK